MTSGAGASRSRSRLCRAAAVRGQALLLLAGACAHGTQPQAGAPAAAEPARAAQVAGCLRDAACTDHFVAGPGQTAAAARVKRRHPRQLVMLRADNRAQFDAGVGILGAVPEITHVGTFPRAAFIAYLRSRGSHVWANALGFERLFEPLRSLVLHATIGRADVVQTDRFLAPPR